MKNLTLGLALALSLLSFSRTSHAGATSGGGAGCQGSLTGGSCNGSFKGFNEAADLFAYIEFEMITVNSGAFYAQYNGQYYSCSLASSSPFSDRRAVAAHVGGHQRAAPRPAARRAIAVARAPVSASSHA
jgi:hypothetical protein